MQYFHYGKKETDHLARSDEKMAALIHQYGKLKRKVIPDLFEALVSSIIAQQISSKAAATVNQRLRNLCGEITPEVIALKHPEVIQQCGTTFKKAGYIKTAASAILDGSIPLGDFHRMDDEAIVSSLITIPGVGRWTVEMLLLHSLQRPDVFSYDDLVIRRSLVALHELSSINKSVFETYRKRYSPYGSVAMIYLWKYGSEEWG